MRLDRPLHATKIYIGFEYLVAHFFPLFSPSLSLALSPPVSCSLSCAACWQETRITVEPSRNGSATPRNQPIHHASLKRLLDLYVICLLDSGCGAISVEPSPTCSFVTGGRHGGIERDIYREGERCVTVVRRVAASISQVNAIWNDLQAPF